MGDPPPQPPQPRQPPSIFNWSSSSTTSQPPQFASLSSSFSLRQPTTTDSSSSSSSLEGYPLFSSSSASRRKRSPSNVISPFSASTVPFTNTNASPTLPASPTSTNPFAPIGSSSNNNAFATGTTASIGGSSLQYRKHSMLGSEPMFPRQMDEDEQEEELDDDVEEEEEEVMMNGSGGTTAEGRSRMGSDSPMLIGSPSFDGPLPLPLLPGSLFAPTVGGNGRTTGGRSRTPSESFGSTNAGGMNTIGGGGGGVPPASPVAIARALQGGQRTPPPFLNRPLFNGMREDHDLGGGGERGSRRESSNSSGDDGAQLEGIGGGGLGLAGTSGSSGGEESGRTGVVRRPVSRRPNLLPKSKSHLRVLSDLRSETGPDLAEIMSEAALHRLSRSAASSIPPPRTSTTSSSVPLSSANLVQQPSTSAPTGLANRFPEQVQDDDDDALLDRNRGGGLSSEDELDELEVGSDWGGMSLGGYGTDTEEGGMVGMGGGGGGWGAEAAERLKNASLWNGIRSNGNGNGSISSSSNSLINNPIRSPSSVNHTPHSSGRIGMTMDVEGGSSSTSTILPPPSPFALPSATTPTWAQPTSTGRPGKRKITTEDRFEPYATAFKRRAVSPAALSSTGSPSSSSVLPISMPSPTLSATAAASHYTFFGAAGTATGGGGGAGGGSRSRGGSPVPSLGSSAGRGGITGGGQQWVMSGRYERERVEQEERQGKIGEAGDGLRGMSLG